MCTCPCSLNNGEGKYASHPAFYLTLRWRKFPGCAPRACLQRFISRDSPAHMATCGYGFLRTQLRWDKRVGEKLGSTSAHWTMERVDAGAGSDAEEDKGTSSRVPESAAVIPKATASYTGAQAEAVVSSLEDVIRQVGWFLVRHAQYAREGRPSSDSIPALHSLICACRSYYARVCSLSEHLLCVQVQFERLLEGANARVPTVTDIGMMPNAAVPHMGLYQVMSSFPVDTPSTTEQVSAASLGQVPMTSSATPLSDASSIANPSSTPMPAKVHAPPPVDTSASAESPSTPFSVAPDSTTNTAPVPPSVHAQGLANVPDAAEVPQPAASLSGTSHMSPMRADSRALCVPIPGNGGLHEQTDNTNEHAALPDAKRRKLDVHNLASDADVLSNVLMDNVSPPMRSSEAPVHTGTDPSTMSDNVLDLSWVDFGSLDGPDSPYADLFDSNVAAASPSSHANTTGTKRKESTLPSGAT